MIKDANIAIITYATPHQKTQDLVSGLLQQGYKNLHLFALPFFPRKVRPTKFIHRFNNPVDMTPEILAQNLNLKYTETTADLLSSFLTEKNFDFTLIGGAGLLPTKLATDFKIINGHPGYLPKVKGLDSLKWAILNEVEEIGVTTHFISEKADEGILIEQKIIPLYCEDSFHSFALRQYTTEIELLINSISIVSSQKCTVSLTNNDYKATMRMPLNLEDEMMEKFELRRKKAPSIWN